MGGTDKILSFLIKHRRDIFTAAVCLAASFAVMLLLPALIIRYLSSSAAMMACLALFFSLDPLFCAAMGVFAGWDMRRRWYDALFPPIMFLISVNVIFGADASEYYVYLIIYTAIVLVVTPFTFLARKYGRTE